MCTVHLHSSSERLEDGVDKPLIVDDALLCLIPLGHEGNHLVLVQLKVEFPNHIDEVVEGDHALLFLVQHAEHVEDLPLGARELVAQLGVDRVDVDEGVDVALVDVPQCELVRLEQYERVPVDPHSSREVYQEVLVRHPVAKPLGAVVLDDALPLQELAPHESRVLDGGFVDGDRAIAHEVGHDEAALVVVGVGGRHFVHVELGLPPEYDGVQSGLLARVVAAGLGDEVEV
mmetsp:Transcript_5419/g.12505  ORF Transcript_5419/g.12505 Transcript_5419/m.12505 type:complete len:231 (-) Transcript_5419:1297-1989(-)